MTAVTLEVLAEDPHPSLARLRESEPVAWLPDLGGWIVTSRARCIEVLRDADSFTVDDERFSTRRVLGPSMLALDGPEHRRHRVPFASSFRSESVREMLATWTAARAKSLVEGISGDGGGDLRSSVASPLATMVMSRVLGLEDVGISQLFAWNERIIHAIDEVTAGRPIPEAGEDAFGELRDAVAATVVSGNLLDDGQLTLDEIAANVAVLLIGGVVTSDGTISIALHHLLRHPATLENVRSDLSLVDKVIEESMRLEPAAAFVDRYATRELELGTASIQKGDLVRVSISAANRDPAVFDEPDRFDTHRPNSGDHIAFARGPHACLGFHVARLEVRAALTAVVRGLAGLRSAPGEEVGPTGMIFRSPETVHAVWDEKQCRVHRC